MTDNNSGIGVHNRRHAMQGLHRRGGPVSGSRTIYIAGCRLTLVAPPSVVQPHKTQENNYYHVARKKQTRTSVRKYAEYQENLTQDCQ